VSAVSLLGVVSAEESGLVIWAVLLLILLGLYVVIGSIRKRTLLINKFVVFLAVVAIGIIVFSNSFGSDSSSQEQQKSRLQEKAPSVQDAPYYVHTSSRAYYIATFDDSEECLTLTSYYYYDRKRWEPSSIPLPLDKQIYGNLKVHRRNIGG